MTQLLIYLVIGGLSLAGIRYRKTRSAEGWFETVSYTHLYMIQELHLPVYHCLCLMLEDRFFG